jgi:hypothetical protein
MSVTAIPGIPDDEIERLHWNFGGGKGTIGFRHVPSGITVHRECPPGVPLAVVQNEVLAEFVKRLCSAGLIVVSKRDTTP